MSQTYIEETPAEGKDEKIEWQVRPFRDGDVRGMVALFNTIDDYYKLHESTTEEQFRSRLNAPRTDPERQILVVEGQAVEGVPANMPVGYGRVFYEEDEVANGRSYFLSVKVHQAAEGLGLGLEHELAGRLMEIVRAYESDPAMPSRQSAMVKAWALEPSANMRALWPKIGLAVDRIAWHHSRLEARRFGASLAPERASLARGRGDGNGIVGHRLAKPDGCEPPVRVGRLPHQDARSSGMQRC